jgi:hypothetical protein
LNKTKIIGILTTAALLSSCALPVYALTTFSDIDNSFAKDAVAMAVELGLLVGNSDGTFNPGGNAERQAVALVASKFLRVVEAQKKQNPIQNQPQPPNTSIPAPEQTEIPAPTQNNNSSSNGGGAGTNNYLST